MIEWTPATLGNAVGTPAAGATLTYTLTWDADMADLRQGCATSGGTCSVSSADRSANQATVSWTLPSSAGDVELIAFVGNSTMTTSARVGARVP
jgi:predicted secreted Zn-dependent protease